MVSINLKRYSIYEETLGGICYIIVKYTEIFHLSIFSFHVPQHDLYLTLSCPKIERYNDQDEYARGNEKRPPLGRILIATASQEASFQSCSYNHNHL